MRVNGAVALSRLSVILSSSLAQDSHLVFWERLEPKIENSSASLNSTESYNNTANSTCHDPCADLQHSVTRGMVLAPQGIALLFFVAGALPVVLFRSRYRVYCVRSCLWVLVELWLHLLICACLFEFDRAQAYGWALHCTTHVLAAWRPKTGALLYPGLQRLASLAGAWCIGLFAWQLGPPIGLAAWYSRSDALCGWKVHLVAVVGVELVAWVLGPLEGVVVG